MPTFMERGLRRRTRVNQKAYEPFEKPVMFSHDREGSVSGRIFDSTLRFFKGFVCVEYVPGRARCLVRGEAARVPPRRRAGFNSGRRADPPGPVLDGLPALTACGAGPYRSSPAWSSGGHTGRRTGRRGPPRGSNCCGRATVAGDATDRPGSGQSPGTPLRPGCRRAV